MDHSFADPASLRAIAGPCETDQVNALKPLIDAVRRRHRHAVRAVVYYGSCLRSGDPTSGLVDFYVIVDRYRAAHASRVSAAANQLLPPNVYYLECDTGVAMLRCKYAVITLDDLQRGVKHGRLSSLWGRFAQPVAIAHAANDEIREALRACCGQAVITLLDASLPALQPPMLPAEAFGAALALSYGGELRTEGGDRGLRIAEQDRPEYARRLHAARGHLTFDIDQCPDGRIAWRPSAAQCRSARRAWRLRARPAVLFRSCGWPRPVSRSITRSTTRPGSSNGTPAWPSRSRPRLRRHPLIYAWPVLWRLYRDGTLR